MGIAFGPNGRRNRRRKRKTNKRTRRRRRTKRKTERRRSSDEADGFRYSFIFGCWAFPHCPRHLSWFYPLQRGCGTGDAGKVERGTGDAGKVERSEGKESEWRCKSCRRRRRSGLLWFSMVSFCGLAKKSK